MTHGIKVIETGKILSDLHYKKHHLHVQFYPYMNAFRVYLVWDDTNEPHGNKVETLCPYNMTKTAAEHFIRYLYWYQTNIAEIDLHRECVIMQDCGAEMEKTDG